MLKCKTQKKTYSEESKKTFLANTNICRVINKLDKKEKISFYGREKKKTIKKRTMLEKEL